MNPARSFGPALVSGTFDDFWIYVVAPVVGALAGAAAYQVARQPAPDPSGSTLRDRAPID